MFKGIQYLFQGFKLITQPGMKRYVIIPLLINILVFVGFFSCAYYYTGLANHWLTAHLPAWLHWLDWMLWLLFVVGILFFFVYLFTVLANIIAAPFNGMLSEKIEELLTGEDCQTHLNLHDWLLLLPKTIMRQLQLLFYFLPRALIMLVLFFIPGVNLAAGVAWFIFSAWMMTIQYLDYPFDNHQMSFKSMIKAMKQRKLIHTEFGIITALLSTIPIINLVIIPAAVAGVTALWVDEYRAKLIKTKKTSC